ncbi:MAG: RNase adaptor protein RapZ, partial [Proteobacteria bacterium]|nr:RNase adaptor protein RapZ [Pseudomonadota bacterium]
MTGERIIIVTGLSGAGMSSALKDLEDMGYEAFDNFPLSLLDALAADPGAAGRPLAVGIDTRSRGFDPAAVRDAAERLSARLLFITADEVALQKRFTETRRRHPMAKDRPVAAGIKVEQELLYSLKSSADVLVETTDLSVDDMRRVLEGHFALSL